jgi:hypothetical protein
VFCVKAFFEGFPEFLTMITMIDIYNDIQQFGHGLSTQHAHHLGDAMNCTRWRSYWYELLWLRAVVFNKSPQVGGHSNIL